MPSIVRDAAVTDVSDINAVHAALDVASQLEHVQQMHTPASTVPAAAVDPHHDRLVVDRGRQLAVAPVAAVEPAGSAVVWRAPPPLPHPQQGKLQPSTPITPSPKQRARGFFSRLLTHLDPLRLHAVSGALYLVLSTGSVLHILSHTLVYRVNPNPLHDLLIPALFVASLVMNCTGFLMAVKHRRGESMATHSCTLTRLGQPGLPAEFWVFQPECTQIELTHLQEKLMCPMTSMPACTCEGVLQRVFYASALVSFGGHLFMW